QFEVNLEVLSRLGPAVAAAEEELAEDVTQAAEARHLEAVQALVPVGVVATTLLRVAQDLVRLGNLLESRLRLLVAAVAVGVIWHHQLAVGAGNLLGAGLAANPENFVVITFACHSARHGLKAPGGAGIHSPMAAPATTAELIYPVYRPGKETCKQSGRRPAAGAFLAPLSPLGGGGGGGGRRLHPSPSPLPPLGRGEKKGAQRTAPATLLAGSSSSILVTITSVVSIKPAMLAAFCSADRVTLVGSTMPALNMST